MSASDCDKCLLFKTEIQISHPKGVSYYFLFYSVVRSCCRLDVFINIFAVCFLLLRISTLIGLAFVVTQTMCIHIVIFIVLKI